MTNDMAGQTLLVALAIGAVTWKYWDYLVNPIMREGGYVRYDGRKSEQILRDCRTLLADYGGSLVRLHELAAVEGGAVDLAALKAAGVVKQGTQHVKIIASGELATAVTVRGVRVTKGARAAIEAAGGKVED